MSLALGAEILNGVYADLGVAADFIPKSGGDETPVLILPDSGDESFDVGGLDLTAARTIFKLRRSEIGAVVIGDKLRFSGVIYRVSTAPRLYDIEKREWTLELVEVRDA